MGLGNHEKMGGRLGVDVVEGIDLLVLIDLVGRNLTRRNLTEQTVAHGTTSFRKMFSPVYHIPADLSCLFPDLPG